jgi:DNA adenine methylase
MLDASAHCPRPPLRYPGGKARVAKRLIAFVPPHTEYREPFLGGGGVFLRKEKARSNWLNDLHPGLCAFWKAVKDHFDAFAALCRVQDAHDLRETFRYWTEERRDLMQLAGDEQLIERAVQYYFINRTVWTGRVVFDPRRKSRLYFSNPDGWGNLDRKLANLALCSQKLQRVRLTCQSFEECLAGATPNTFIYADPPYIRDSLDTPTSKLYEGHFTLGQHERLRDLLEASPAQVMASYDDRRTVRNLYAKSCWRIIPLSWKYCGRYAVTKRDKLAGRKERKVEGRELLIVNYDPPRAG